MGSKGSPIIHFDYEFSPVGQKTKMLLTAAGVEFDRVDQPVALPRKDLEALGITYRRIPVLAVGKDVYCDSALIFDLVTGQLAKGKVKTSPHDKAWEAWGVDAFEDVLTLIPLEVLTPDFIKDRETIFPIVARSDYASLKPSGIAELQSRMEFLENVALADGPFIGGDKISVADIQAIWGIRWGLSDGTKYPPGLGGIANDGFGKDQFPKVWKLIDSLPDPKPKTIDANEAIKTIEGSLLTSNDEGVMKNDPTGIKAGANVTIDSLDSAPHSHPQKGKLVATARNEIVIELPNGIRLHFPREGYILREA